MNIYDIINRAESLRKETAINGISPERAGSIMSDTLKYLNDFQIQSGSIGLDKIYTSSASMSADEAPASDFTGQPLKAGQLCVIVPADSTDTESGDVYRYDGEPGFWTKVGQIGNISRLIDSVARILRDLGLYPTALSLALSVGKSGKYVDPDGQEVASSSMSISAPLQLKAGNIYLFQSSQPVGMGVSLFARQVTRTYDKVIVYTTIEEDTSGRPTKIQADYDASLVYTVTYDDEGNASYRDASGSPVESLPTTHVVTESFYEPLFRTNDTSMPSSGYYLFLCTTDMDVVISGYTADVSAGKNLLGVRYGAFATIATNFVGTPGQKVLAQALCQLEARIKVLESLIDRAGHLKVELLDMADLPLVCGEKMYMTGSGAPSVPPTVPFQEYYDQESGITYKAKGVLPDTPTVSDWKPLN